MNKRGQLVLVGIMIAIMTFLTMIVFIEPLKEGIGLARDSSHLDCTNTSISTGQKMTCIYTDLYLPLFLGFCMAISLAYLGIKEYKASQQ